MYSKNLSCHILLVLRPINALLVLTFPAFEGLQGNINLSFVVCNGSYSRKKRAKVNANIV